MNITGTSHNSLLGRILRYPLRFIPAETVVPILQGKLKGKKWVVGSSIHGCWLGSFEREKQKLFEKIITEGSTVLDIGAHVGFYSLLSSILVGQKGKVYAFEPAHRNLLYLKRHIFINKINNIFVIEAAVSEQDGYTYFDEGPSSLLGRISPEGKLMVKTVSLDSLYSKGEITIPNYLKIDVEGAEMLVLSGAKSILSKYHPTIFLATHGEAIHNQCCGFLESLGYELKSITGGDVKYSPVNYELLCRKR